MSEFNTATSNYYTGVYYSQEIGIENEGGTALTITENVYSLKTNVVLVYL